MEVVEDENIATASTMAPKFFSNPRMEQLRTVDTTMSSSSMRSVETHPPSTRNSNPFSYQPSSSDTADSRQDIPEKKQREDSDAMMTSADASSGLVLPSSARVVTGDTNVGRVSSFGHEEKVSLAPRFEKLKTSNRDEPDEQGNEEENDLGSLSMFSISGSMSSEFLENQQFNDDHQQEYLHHPNRVVVGINSPTSTTDRRFLREVQCPNLPSYSGESAASSRTGFGSTALPLHHSFTHTGSTTNRQRPPFPPSVGFPPPNPPQIPSLSHTNNKASHPTLPQEHVPNSASSSSPTNTIPGVGSYNCDRDKPVISRCFAWSQDSQDDRRITKRARTTPNGKTSSDSSPLSTETTGVMSPSSALETIQGSAVSFIATKVVAMENRSLEIPGNHDSVSPPPSSSPTKVHWEEIVEHPNELMSRAVDPQVLFGVSSAIQIATTNNEDVAMGNTNEGNRHETNDRMLPPITTARSASHYSFDSL